MKHQKGFTLPEIIIITGIILMLFGFITLNVINTQYQTSISTTVDTLIADIKSQQIKAMAGNKETGSSPESYGIHFESSKYTLFHGSTYSPGDSSNFTINLSFNIQFRSNSRSEIIFEKGSGEIYQFSNSTNQIILQDTTGNTKTISINLYGTVVGIN